MTRFWPVCETAQADYEKLRSAALANIPLLGSEADRFRRGGLAALIRRPMASPCFVAELVGVPRPRGSPYSDPRVETLAEIYQLLSDRLCVVAVEVAE